MRWLHNVLLAAVSALAALLSLEAGLRLFPVSDVTRVRPLGADSRPFDVASVRSGEIRYSRLWNFRNARTRKTNNYGFLSDYDYEKGHRGPVAIGDSFVEALQVDFGETFHQRLAARAGAPVYNLALSGAPLSQYEAYLSQACREFAPARAIIAVVANDFEESFARYRARSGFFHYREDGTLAPTPYELGPLRRAANASSLVKYVYFNLGMGGRIRGLISDLGVLRAARAGEGAGAARAQGLAAARRRAADLFLARVKTHCLAPEDIAFLVDADRNADWGIYGGNSRRSAHLAYFMARARRAGYRVIDLNPVMRAGWERTGRRFEFPFDAHWNARGHAAAAAAVRASGFLAERGGGG